MEDKEVLFTCADRKLIERSLEGKKHENNKLIRYFEEQLEAMKSDEAIEYLEGLIEIEEDRKIFHDDMIERCMNGIERLKKENERLWELYQWSLAMPGCEDSENYTYPEEYGGLNPASREEFLEKMQETGMVEEPLYTDRAFVDQRIPLKWSCPYCGLLFSSNEELFTHIEDKHRRT